MVYLSKSHTTAQTNLSFLKLKSPLGEEHNSANSWWLEVQPKNNISSIVLFGTDLLTFLNSAWYSKYNYLVENGIFLDCLDIFKGQ
jgi:hypothetical protein